MCCALSINVLDASNTTSVVFAGFTSDKDSDFLCVWYRQTYGNTQKHFSGKYLIVMMNERVLKCFIFYLFMYFYTTFFFYT